MICQILFFGEMQIAALADLRKFPSQTMLVARPMSRQASVLGRLLARWNA